MDHSVIKTVQSRLGLGREQSSDNFLGSEIISSLPLQMALFYNVYFAPLWFTASLTALLLKHSHLPEYYQFLTPTVLSIMTVFELIRLYCGYVGNLQERVPELSAFWMVTLILQLPLALYSLLDSGAIILPLEISVNVILLGFLVVELLVCTSTIRHMTLVQETKFSLLNDSARGTPDPATDPPATSSAI